MKTTSTLIVLLILVAAACGDPGSTDAGDPGDATTTTIEPPATTTPPDTVDPDAVILEVRDEGGFMPVNELLNRMPNFVVYADGRLLVPAPIPEIFPGPLLRRYNAVQLSDSQMEALLEAIDATDIANMTDERFTEADNVADAPDTVFTYIDDGPHRVSIYAFGFNPVPDPAIAPFAALYELLVDYTLSATDMRPVEPAGYQVVVSPSFGVENEEQLATVEPWPLSIAAADVPSTSLSDLQCITLVGDDAAAVTPIFEAANQLTFFEDAGTVYRLNVRPLAHHEAGCPA